MLSIGRACSFTEVPSSALGIVYVDLETQQRTPKMSAHFLHAVRAQNAVV